MHIAALCLWKKGNLVRLHVVDTKKSTETNIYDKHTCYRGNGVKMMNDHVEIQL